MVLSSRVIDRHFRATANPSLVRVGDLVLNFMVAWKNDAMVGLLGRRLFHNGGLASERIQDSQFDGCFIRHVRIRSARFFGLGKMNCRVGFRVGALESMTQLLGRNRSLIRADLAHARKIAIFVVEVNARRADTLVGN